MTKRLRIIVAGAGFAGLNVAKGLQDDHDVAIVCPTDRFVFLPLIHEVLSENVTPDDVTRHLDDVLDKCGRVHGRAKAVEGHELVTTAGERLPFDRLVVAVGAESNDFGIPGVAENCLSFYSVGDALRANATLKVAVAQGHDSGTRLRIVVVGGGYTGVEVAGEVKMLLDKLSADHEIVVMDALPEIFPTQSPKFRREIQKGLDRLGIKVRTGQKITKVTADHLVVDHDGEASEVACDISFWCAGVRPRTLGGVDPNVRPTLQSASRDDVFVLGDAANFPKAWKVPKLAQTAEDQAKVVVQNLQQPGRMREYRPDVRGVLVSIGHNHAVAELAGGRVLSGNIPWHVKRNLYKAKIALA